MPSPDGLAISQETGLAFKQELPAHLTDAVAEKFLTDLFKQDLKGLKYNEARLNQMIKEVVKGSKDESGKIDKVALLKHYNTLQGTMLRRVPAMV